MAARPAHHARRHCAERGRTGAGQCRVLCAAADGYANRPARFRWAVSGRGAGRPDLQRACWPGRVRVEPAQAAAAGGARCGAGGRTDLPRDLLRAAAAAGHGAGGCAGAAPPAACRRRCHPGRLDRAAPLAAADHRAGGVQRRCRTGDRWHLADTTPAPDHRLAADPGNLAPAGQSGRCRAAADRPGPAAAQPCCVDARARHLRVVPVADLATRWAGVDRAVRPAGGGRTVGLAPRVLSPGGIVG
ncbi:hypothetical protein D3C71_1420440 [compost metagenome]